MKLPDGWTTEPITIATVAGETCIPAFVNGALAVHPSYEDGDGWRVTHRRSGRLLAVASDSFNLTREIAFATADELLAKVADWGWDSLEAIPATERAVISRKLWTAKRELLDAEVQS